MNGEKEGRSSDFELDDGNDDDADNAVTLYVPYSLYQV